MTMSFREQRLLRRSMEHGSAVVERGEQEQEDPALKRRIDNIRNNLFPQFASIAAGKASSEYVSDLQKGVQKIYKEDVKYWEDMLQDNIRILVEFEQALSTQRSGGLLTQKTEEYWTQWMKKKIPNAEKRRVIASMPAWFAKLRVRVDKRDKLAALPRVKELRKTIANADLLMDRDRFINAKTSEQKDIIARVEAAIRSKEDGTDSVYDEAKGLLDTAANAGYFHPNKIGKWLNYAMTRSNPESYIHGTLRYFLANWKVLAAEYDSVKSEASRAENPPSVPPRMTFLAMSHAQCKVELDRIRKELKNGNAESKENLKASESEKLLVKTAIRRKDWEDAKEQATSLQKKYPKDAAVAALVEMVAAHPVAKKEPKPAEDKRTNAEIQRDINSSMDHLPTSVKTAAIHSAELGPGAVTTYWDLLYNRGRAKQKGYTDDVVEMQDAEDKRNDEKTRERMRYGHEHTVEKNMLRGNAEDLLAINNDPTHAQVLHTPDSDHAQRVLAEACQRNQGNGRFRIKTVVVPENVPHARNETLVSQAFPRIVKDVRKLSQRNVRYSYAGNLQDATEMKEETEKEAA